MPIANQMEVKTLSICTLLFKLLKKEIEGVLLLDINR